MPKISFVKPIANFYEKYEKPISSLFLIGGFIFDTLTLKRVDTLFENIWILGCLAIVGIFIILVNSKEEGSKAHFWYGNILQFFLGSTLSAYLVFYFRSTEFSSTWPFIFLLAFVFIANESFKKNIYRISFQIGLFFLSIFSFCIFFTPVILHKIGTDVFLLSGAISLGIITLYVSILFYFLKYKKKEVAESKRLILSIVLGIFTLFNFLYFTNLIPPIPLSLKDAGVYHSIERVVGGYKVTYEESDWRDYFKIYPEFNLAQGSSAYVFSAIFSPRNFNLTIIHEWQLYNETQNKWETKSIIKLPVVGGRDNGFRTYSMKSSLEIGKWKVNIKTEEGSIVGIKRFRVVNKEANPALIVGIK